MQIIKRIFFIDKFVPESFQGGSRANVPSIGNLILAQEPKEGTLVSLVQLLLLEVILQILGHLPLVLQRHGPRRRGRRHSHRRRGLLRLRILRRRRRRRRRSRLHRGGRLGQRRRCGQSRRLGRWRQRRRGGSPGRPLRLGAPDHGERRPACPVARRRDRDASHLHLDGRNGGSQRHFASCCLQGREEGLPFALFLEGRKWREGNAWRRFGHTHAAPVWIRVCGGAQLPSEKRVSKQRWCKAANASAELQSLGLCMMASLFGL